jgi:replication factor A1
MFLSNRYDSGGNDTSMAPVGADMGATRTGGSKSTYSDRVSLSHITNDPTMGQDKVHYFDVCQYMKSFHS